MSDAIMKTPGRKTTILGPNGKYYQFDIIGFSVAGESLPLGAVALTTFSNEAGRQFNVLVTQADYDAYVAATVQRAMSAPFGTRGLGSPAAAIDWPIAHLAGGRQRIGGYPLDLFRGISIDDLSFTYQTAYSGSSTHFRNGGYTRTIPLTGLAYPFNVLFTAPAGVMDTPHFIRFRLFRNQFTPSQTSFSLTYFSTKGNGPFTIPEMAYPLGAVSMIDQLLFELPAEHAANSVIKPDNFLIANTQMLGAIPFLLTLHSAPEQGRLIIDFPPATEVPVMAVQNFTSAAYANQLAIDARRNDVLMALAAGNPVA